MEEIKQRYEEMRAWRTNQYFKHDLGSQLGFSTHTEYVNYEINSMSLTEFLDELLS